MVNIVQVPRPAACCFIARVQYRLWRIFFFLLCYGLDTPRPHNPLYSLLIAIGPTTGTVDVHSWPGGLPFQIPFPSTPRHQGTVAGAFPSQDRPLCGWRTIPRSFHPRLWQNQARQYLHQSEGKHPVLLAQPLHQHRPEGFDGPKTVPAGLSNGRMMLRPASSRQEVISLSESIPPPARVSNTDDISHI